MGQPMTNLPPAPDDDPPGSADEDFALPAEEQAEHEDRDDMRHAEACRNAQRGNGKGGW